MGTQLQQQQPPSLVGRSMQPAASMHGAGMGVGVDGQQQRLSPPLEPAFPLLDRDAGTGETWMTVAPPT